MKKDRSTPFRRALPATLPVMAGYLVLGIGFGVVMRSKGYGAGWTAAMSLTIFAGSMQYAAAELLASGAGLLTAALTTLAVNARHLFYGVSMVEKYRHRRFRPFLIFTLTDETYSIVSSETSAPEEGRESFDLWVSGLDYFYWVSGSVLGALLGGILPFSTEGIDFSLTALFLTVFTEQWLTVKDHRPALLGLRLSLASLLLFGAEDFLIPAMLAITCSLLLLRRKEGDRV